MLFNPAHARPTLDVLIGWLEMKDGAYNYGHASECMAAQFFRSIGIEGDASILLPERMDEIMPGLWDIARGDYRPASWTFSNALDRAYAARAQASTAQFMALHDHTMAMLEGVP